MKKGFVPVFLLFLLVTAVVFLCRKMLAADGIDVWVILGGNAVLFVVALLSMYMNAQAMAHRNTHGFMRNVYGGFLLKFVVIIAAAVAYISFVKTVNKPALFICLGLYLFYTFLSTRNVLNNKKPVIDGNRKSGV